MQNSLSYDGKTLTATVGKQDSYTVIFSTYENGRLLQLTTFVQTFKAGANMVEILNEVDISEVHKIYLWNNLSSMQPVCSALDMLKSEK